MLDNVHREVTQLTPEDSFVVNDRVKDDFDFPIHFHPDYELNFIQNGKGVRRIVGDSIEEIDDIELVFVGSNLVHGWELHKCTSKRIHEITIHINHDLLDEKLLARNIFKPIRDMMAKSAHGILFSKKTSREIAPRLIKLMKTDGIDYYLEFVSVLYDLANSRNQRMLSNSTAQKRNFENSSKIKKVYDYIQDNFDKKISLDEISSLVNMTPVSFNRFIKKRTGKTFVIYVNSTRISHASKLLLETDLSIAEISFKCGFNNIANFNRIFKKEKNTTPSEFREEFNGGIKRVL
ncbi:AraC family transcriptional regulator [Hyunsoonleella pacifica]|uniref:AraC family transcriptional regulator n=1 Tax=Hyunsoonleella pacifica TaxID=1080224 RepID=A0A4V2JB27_9FLAO|nr:AraC family transcriptional regulator [Hyunsoonleella pacifica]TBN16583.1 AraC family transcriptional regulator [Hyunsoonleella pacifica]GGD18197.1 AraC family transcriptional regulator [Hyunsoonleella pacifica]